MTSKTGWQRNLLIQCAGFQASNSTRAEGVQSMGHQNSNAQNNHRTDYSGKHERSLKTLAVQGKEPHSQKQLDIAPEFEENW